MGEAKFLTVVSPEEPDGAELLLEPLGFPPARTYQKALFEARVPLTAFQVDDIQKEYERMKKLGVPFRGEPTKEGPVPSGLIPKRFIPATFFALAILFSCVITCR